MKIRTISHTENSFGQWCKANLQEKWLVTKDLRSLNGDIFWVVIQQQAVFKLAVLVLFWNFYYTVKPPNPKPKPSVIIQGPNLCSICGTITLSMSTSTGSAGRKFSSKSLEWFKNNVCWSWKWLWSHSFEVLVDKFSDLWKNFETINIQVDTRHQNQVIWIVFHIIWKIKNVVIYSLFEWFLEKKRRSLKFNNLSMRQ